MRGLQCDSTTSRHVVKLIMRDASLLLRTMRALCQGEKATSAVICKSRILPSWSIAFPLFRMFSLNVSPRSLPPIPTKESRIIVGRREAEFRLSKLGGALGALPGPAAGNISDEFILCGATMSYIHSYSLFRPVLHSWPRGKQ